MQRPTPSRCTSRSPAPGTSRCPAGVPPLPHSRVIAEDPAVPAVEAQLPTGSARGTGHRGKWLRQRLRGPCTGCSQWARDPVHQQAIRLARDDDERLAQGLVPDDAGHHHTRADGGDGADHQFERGVRYVMALRLPASSMAWAALVLLMTRCRVAGVDGAGGATGAGSPGAAAGLDGPGGQGGRGWR